MSVIDRAFDLDKPAEAATAGDGRKEAGSDVPVESRTRGECYADLRQAAESGWDRRLKFDAPRGELERFEPGLAGLPEVSAEEASRYIKRYRDERPWLQVVEGASPEVRRVFVAADMGGVHGHVRHEGWVSEEASMRRAANLEDPAQLDPGKRARGIDGLRPRGRDHVSAEIATRVTDPAAFATAFKRGSDHPRVRAAVNGHYPPDTYPREVSLPIASLIGEEGHKFCTGWILKPEKGESMDDAKGRRHEWRDAVRKGREPDGPGPAVQPVPTFEGGTMVFRVAPRKDGGGYAIASMFPHPREDILEQLQAVRQPPEAL
jgi:hypothetical protein